MQFKALILSAFMAGAAMAAPTNTNTNGISSKAVGNPTTPGTSSSAGAPSVAGSGLPGFPGLPPPGSAPNCEELAKNIASCAAKGEWVQILICAGTNAPTACGCYQELPKGEIMLPVIDQICEIIAPGNDSSKA
ncbi:hypothetical protein MGYG_07233 [Nannizzia gypsea CBS 118893]|uniref:Hydrophobin n=1 Tax=Arthroderma gypseum (strain ATCC MYA-4604 / CBS 118893) TaxID=535722 RepID=E4V2G1_ARTGP|nr:hypothetical protein MGYG_07233 [Nannizzia gypsea CBS 118893]EFR04226.1 hypothetical protein MGYG_07233 [Nannizzia gypsea CBS 118893]